MQRLTPISSSNPYFKEDVIRLRETGFSALQIAKFMGTSHTPVRQVLKDAGMSTAPIKRINGRKLSRVNGHGYIELYLPDHGNAGPEGYVREHVYAASLALGRPLKSGEVVHHINGDRQDNRGENLLICSREYHAELHHRMSSLYMKEHFPQCPKDLPVDSWKNEV